MRLSIGQKVVCITQTFSSTPKRMKGTVIWVHPKKRFARVSFEFAFKHQKFKLVECFPLSEISLQRK